jgi:cobalamin-dependent methionine synthase I
MKREWPALRRQAPDRPACTRAGDGIRHSAHDIFFDPLALPISTGIEEDRKNADETIKSISRSGRKCPRRTSSSAFRISRSACRPAARVVLNSVFLHDASRRDELGDRQRVEDIAADAL